MLPVVGNSGNSGNAMIRRATHALAARLPQGWRLSEGPSRSKSRQVDTLLKIISPTKQIASIFVETKSRLEPRDVDLISSIVRPRPDEPVIIIAPFLSPRTQERLTAAGFGYADLTGNVRLSAPTAGLFIETSGARENPQPTLRDRKSLRGAKAGRLVRALADFRPPVGLRELAKRAGVDPGYTSRVVDVLNREALLVRTARGPITDVDWSALLRRWSQAYSPFQRPDLTWYLAARGLTSTVEKLKTVSVPYTVSGSWAATQFAPVAPARLLLCYADDPEALARELDLRQAETGANVALLTPYDPIVYERTSQRKGVTVAALSQVAVDLLTSPGRGPNEGDALLEWMRANENVWRT